MGSASTFKVKFSIVAGNNQADLGFQDCANGTEVVDLGANLIGDASCAGFSNDTNSYSLLNELEDNGCEGAAGFSSNQCVPTHALLAVNPAVACGDCSAEPAASPPLEALLVASSSGLPSYRWTVVEDATWYQLYVNDESGNRYSRWMTADYFGCADGASECDFFPATYSSTGASQLVGSVAWWVKTWNCYGHGPWSGTGVFSVGADVPPVAAVLVLPSGVTNANPALLWQAVSNASWYYLWVEDEGALVHRQWYTSVATGCASGDSACSIT